MKTGTKPKKHVCGTCRKPFTTKEARRQHSNALHRVLRPLQEQQGQRQPQEDVGGSREQPPSGLSHRNIMYSTLSPGQQLTLRGELPGLCLTEARLGLEGYMIREGASTCKGKNQVPGQYRFCPPQVLSQPKSTAIVLDCEMAGAAAGHNEVIHLTIIDFFSGRVLQNWLVNPTTSITDWRTDITGIDARMLESVAPNEALQGWEAAQAALWDVADKETIIIGQSVSHDLHVLRTSHLKVIDLAVVTADAVLGKRAKKIKKRWALKTLCQELLGMEIRQPSRPGGPETHDTLEDALATREVLLLCLLEPERLNRWARATRREFYKPRAKKKKGHLAIHVAKSPRRGSCGDNYIDDDGHGYEPTTTSSMMTIERWEDVVDWDMWPKSPPDSD